MSEAINHPQHYGGDTTYEAIKVIEAWQLEFCLGNTVKYICRAGKKEGNEPVQDLKKAAWYLNRRLIQLGAAQPEPKTKRQAWEHTYIDGCKNKCGACNLCCLSVCSRCGLFEGALTTHCPGEHVPDDKGDMIYAGKLNYRGGHWLEEKSEHTPRFFEPAKLFDPKHVGYCRCTMPRASESTVDDGGRTLIICAECSKPQCVHRFTGRHCSFCGVEEGHEPSLT